MKKNKINLHDLKIQSFVTSLKANEENTVQGGRLITNSGMCPGNICTDTCSDPALCNGSNTGCDPGGGDNSFYCTLDHNCYSQDCGSINVWC